MASWLDALLPASFAGLALLVESGSGGTCGRRVQLTSYPFSDRFDIEDMGQLNSPFTLKAFLLDDAGDLQRRHDDLVSALNAGENTLVHPRLGTMRVVPGRCTYTFQGSRIRYELEFLPPLEAPTRSEQLETSAQVTSAADAALETVNSEAAETLNTSQRTLFDDAQAYVGSALSTLREVNGGIDAALAPISETTLLINEVGDQLVSLIQTPSDLLSRMAGLFNAVLTLEEDVDQALVNVQNLRLERVSTAQGEGYTATARSANQRTLNAAFNTAIVVAAVNLVVSQSRQLNVNNNANSPFDSYQHAIVVRDALVAEIDSILPDVSHASYDALIELRAQFYRHIDAHGIQLPRIRQVQFGVGLPAWVIAHDVYGDAHRMDDLLRRNQIAQPCYIAPETTLEILDEI